MTKYCKDQCIICIFCAPQKYFESKLVYSRMIIKTHARVNKVSTILHESYYPCSDLNCLPIKVSTWCPLLSHQVSELIMDTTEHGLMPDVSDGTWISRNMGGCRLTPEGTGGCQYTLSLYQDCNLRLQPINTLDWKIEVQKTTLCFFSMDYAESVKNEEGFSTIQLTELKSSWKVIIHCQI